MRFKLCFCFLFWVGSNSVSFHWWHVSLWKFCQKSPLRFWNEEVAAAETWTKKDSRKQINDTVNKNTRIRNIEVYRVNAMLFMLSQSSRVFFCCNSSAILFDSFWLFFWLLRTPVHFNLKRLHWNCFWLKCRIKLCFHLKKTQNSPPRMLSCGHYGLR